MADSLATSARDPHGRQAESPTEVPRRGWRDVATRTLAEMKQDRATLLSAGVAFYLFLALVPALVVVISVYGIVSDPSEVRSFVRDSLGAAPREVRQLVSSQLQDLVRTTGGKAGLAAVIGTLIALWSASSGMSHLVEAINAAFDEDDDRKFLAKRSLALALTVGAFVFGAVAITLIVFLPTMLADAVKSDVVRWVVGVLRWPLLAVVMMVALAALYRLAPNRDAAEWKWVTPGAIVAVVVWIAGSLLFSLYAANFGRFQATYGSLSSIIVLLLWLLLTTYIVIAGAEINAELERQTAKDTTQGRDQPLGRRDAYAADTIGETAEEVRSRR